MPSPPPARPDALEAFLHYGFVPAVPPDLAARPWAAPPGPPLPDDEERCLAAGLAALEAAFADVPPGPQVVPLSGGLDSRVILGMLVAAGARERIQAVTFGTPGTLDFELATAVARAAGVRHERIDLTREPLDAPGLRAALPPGGPWTHAFEAHFNALVPRRFGAGATLWSGILANVINGSRVGDPHEDWAAARRSYARHYGAVRSGRLTRPGFDAAASLPEAPLLAHGTLTYEEQLHLGVHYPSRFERVLLAPGFAFRTPFAEPPWVAFALRLPRALRLGERAFRAVIRRRLPELMALPTKTCHGVPLSAPAWRLGLARQRRRVARRLRRLSPWAPWGPAPEANYLAFDLELRRPSPARAVVQGCLARLAARRVVDWLDLDELWTRHQRRRANLADALVLLAELELNLSAAE
ncbi:MAG TPA: asparagine synthase C-terminal domain-containing protein [Planctomycetota bacterium]